LRPLIPSHGLRSTCPALTAQAKRFLSAVRIDQAFELGLRRPPLVSDDHRLAGDTGAIGGREFIRAIEIGQADAGLAAIAAEVSDFAAMPGDLMLNEGQMGARHYTEAQ
jgi:hypothetical protein